MSQLASIQLALDEALRGRRPSGAVPHVKESDRAARVAIHQRNYRVSLTEALRVKFPATGWLVGEGFLDYGARLFVERHAPDSPCIAEYGFEFADFLSALPGTLRLPYLADFMKLEWFFGKASIAVSRPAFDPSSLGSVPTDRLADSTAELQPGLFYLRTSWPVDRLLDLYLRESAPDSLEFEPAGRRLEISGARGQVRLECLTLPDFAFREALWKGQTLGRAAETALRFSEFDPERAMRSLAASGLMVGIRTSSPEETRL